MRDANWLERVMAVQHPTIVEGLNEARRIRGLPPVKTKGDPEARLVPSARGWRSEPSAATLAKWAAADRDQRRVREIDRKLAERAAKRRPRPVARPVAAVTGDALRRKQREAGQLLERLRAKLKASRAVARRARGTGW